MYTVYIQEKKGRWSVVTSWLFAFLISIIVALNLIRFYLIHILSGPYVFRTRWPVTVSLAHEAVQVQVGSSCSQSVVFLRAVLVHSPCICLFNPCQRIWSLFRRFQDGVVNTWHKKIPLRKKWKPKLRPLKRVFPRDTWEKRRNSTSYSHCRPARTDSREGWWCIILFILEKCTQASQRKNVKKCVFDVLPWRKDQGKRAWICFRCLSVTPVCFPLQKKILWICR